MGVRIIWCSSCSGTRKLPPSRMSCRFKWREVGLSLLGQQDIGYEPDPCCHPHRKSPAKPTASLLLQEVFAQSRGVWSCCRDCTASTDVLRPESPEINVPRQPLGPKTSNNPASAFLNFHQEDANPVRATHPVRFQCPDQRASCSFPSNPTIATLQPFLIGIIFFNVGLSLVSSTAFQPGFPLTALPQRACQSILMPWDHGRAQDHAGMQEPILQERSWDIPIHTGMGWGSRCRGEGKVSRGSGWAAVRRRRGDHEAAGEFISL